MIRNSNSNNYPFKTDFIDALAFAGVANDACLLALPAALDSTAPAAGLVRRHSRNLSVPPGIVVTNTSRCVFGNARTIACASS